VSPTRTPRAGRIESGTATLQRRLDWQRLKPYLLDQADDAPDELPTTLRRRRMVVVVALIVGTSLLGLSLSVRPGGAAFYPLTGAVAIIWAGGGLLSGPLRLGWVEADGQRRRPVLSALALGLLIAAIFVVGALIVREIPPLSHLTEHVLAHARKGFLPLVVLVTLLNAIAEEIFFRGALFAAIGPRHRVAICTVLYALVTLASGNLMLVFAALTLGVVLAGQRRASGGILAPMITHFVWSAVLVFALPAIFPS
jgi:membrane protease YdiL (CAAX protease family)